MFNAGKPCCQKSLQCYNRCNCCLGAFIKNGVVRDGAGDHTVRKSGLTSLLKYTSEDFANKDCMPVSGGIEYSYATSCEDTLRVFVDYFVSACNPSLLADRTGVPTRVELDLTNSQCTPFVMTYTGETNGLDVPWGNVVASFDIDEDATLQCKCRVCNALIPTHATQGLFPNSDLSLSYSVAVGAEIKTGTITLTRMFNVDSFGDFEWISNVDWWTEASISNSTNDPAGHNVNLNCLTLQFLNWEVDTLTPTTFLDNRVRYDLITDDVVVGNVTIKTVSEFDVPRECCSPCDLRYGYDYHLSFVRETNSPGQDVSFVTQFEGVLVYSATPYSVPGSTASNVHWKMEPKAWDGRTGLWTAYFGCEIDLIFGSDLGGTPFQGGNPGSDGNRFTCYPIHRDYFRSFGNPSQPDFDYGFSHIYLDEIVT